MQEMQETWVLSLDQKDAHEKGKTTHSSILLWRILWKKSLAGYRPWGCKELDMTEHAHSHTNNEAISV